MRIYKRIVLIIMVIAIMIGLSSCTTFNNFKEAFIEKSQDQNSTIRIGLYEPMSGSDKGNAEEEIRGIRLAHEQYNTINGKTVELVEADNASDIYAAETAIKELVLKDPLVILGSYGSVYSLVAGKYINNDDEKIGKKAHIPTIAITNMNPLVTKKNDYYFRVCYVDSNQGDILARYLLEEKKVKTAGVLLPEGDDAAMEKATAFTEKMKENNTDAITVYEGYTAGDEDFTKQLREIDKAGVENVFLPGEINDSLEIIRQAKKMGLNTVFLGDSSWAAEEFEEMAENDSMLNNTEFISFFGAEEADTYEAEKFLKAYQSEYGSDSTPSDAAALGYDAYIIAIRAIEAAGESAMPEDVRNVLAEETKVQGASGYITFDYKGDPIKTAYISTWNDGKLETISTINPAL